MRLSLGRAEWLDKEVKTALRNMVHSRLLMAFWRSWQVNPLSMQEKKRINKEDELVITSQRTRSQL